MSYTGEAKRRYWRIWYYLKGGKEKEKKRNAAAWRAKHPKRVTQSIPASAMHTDITSNPVKDMA